MWIQSVIEELKELAKTGALKLHSGASEAELKELEVIYNKVLPEDFRTFYKFCNGFETDEDIFNMVMIEEIIENKKRFNNSLYIAEYMIYSDSWELDISPQNPNDYQITNLTRSGTTITLTRSLAEFIHRFLKGGVFEKGGLYDWHEEILKG
ncbi:SMI1/KNR4 family protein [Pedobacter frigoris]|uniref:SMI1/KNR4 family protein n=1 Tax=Pedobacter frigoris TaxID=2571272 RepID=UPI0029311DB6|nr:SMI1/KNR4 family protein [Pedobacter frigoris]